MAKPEHEFFDVTSVAWTPVSGRAEGLYERILARDERTGTVTRILRFDPGCNTTPNGVQEHDFWEEIYILQGAITDLTLNQTFSQGMYACRPPGMRHGPWFSKDGCMTFEVRYQ